MPVLPLKFLKICSQFVKYNKETQEFLYKCASSCLFFNNFIILSRSVGFVSGGCLHFPDEKQIQIFSNFYQDKLK